MVSMCASLQSYAMVLPVLVICDNSANALTVSLAREYIETLSLHAFSQYIKDSYENYNNNTAS